MKQRAINEAAINGGIDNQSRRHLEMGVIKISSVAWHRKMAAISGIIVIGEVREAASENEKKEREK